MIAVKITRVINRNKLRFFMKLNEYTVMKTTENAKGNSRRYNNLLK